MDLKKLQNLENKISMGKIQQSKELFGGANLIIVNSAQKPNYKNHKQKYPQDVLVFTDHPKEFSWLVFQLKDVFEEELDASNKYVFYPMIGEIINKGLKKEIAIQSIMFSVITACLKLKISNIIE